MNDLTSAIEYAGKPEAGVLAACLITILLIVTGFQRIREIIAYALMALYEFFIQKNAMKL